MRTLCQVFTVAAFGFAVAITGPAVAAPEPQSSERAIAKAFNAAKNESWSEAFKYAERADDPLTVKIIEWLRYQKANPKLKFSQIAGFIEANPTWPRMSRLRRSAEAVVGAEENAATIIDWFGRYPPLSGAGALAHLDALVELGQLADARALVPRYWKDLNYTRDQDKAFQRKYGKQLANADHIERLDRLIWDQKYWPARRMLPRVGQPQAALGRARLALMRREGGVDGAIARVPTGLRDTSGLQYERLRWRRRKGKDRSARELLQAAPAFDAYQDRWVFERLILSRRALVDGHYTEARQLVATHNLKSGARFAEAEFLAGWISLTFLNEPDAAYRHFTRLYDGVNYPISLARGAFWAGRAAAAAGDDDNATRWWQVAAEFPATFYGQQAISALGETEVRIAFTAPQFSPVSSDSAAPDLMRAVRLLDRQNQKALITPFLRQLTELSDSLDERIAVIRLANEVGHPHEGIRAAKRVAQLDKVVPTLGYPFVEFENSSASTVKQQREVPLILALIRQESAFYPRAVSRAGARGMMQLLPTTAKRVARATGQRYSRARLLDDPQYNIRLGRAYLGTMMSRFDHAPALALAAYNAGPGRVDRWVRQIGDPRTGEIDLVDWIEAIPFNETRNYVQRVLESEIVYRQLFLNEQLASRPSKAAPANPEGNKP
jgi:soluble lytic murein transglycosylase